MYQFSQTLAAALNAKKPQRVLIEFFRKPSGTAYSPVVQFSNEDILVSNGLQLNTEFIGESDLTIGLCPSAEIRFTLLNDAGQLNSFEFGRFRAYLGARIDSGTPGSSAKTKSFTEDGVSRLYEFAPLGVFEVQRPDVVRVQTIDVSANDLMTLFDEDMPSASALELTYPSTVGTIVQKLCSYVGVTLASTTFLNSTLAVSAEPEQFGDASMRDVLKWAGEVACSIVRFNRAGSLEFVWFNTTTKVYDEHNYSEFTPSWYETKAIDNLHVRNAESTAESVTGSGSNPYLIQNNPFLKV